MVQAVVEPEPVADVEQTAALVATMERVTRRRRARPSGSAGSFLGLAGTRLGRWPCQAGARPGPPDRRGGPESATR